MFVFFHLTFSLLIYGSGRFIVFLCHYLIFIRIISPTHLKFVLLLFDEILYVNTAYIVVALFRWHRQYVLLLLNALHSFLLHRCQTS